MAAAAPSSVNLPGAAENDRAARIVTLDIVRGVAVMGILAMNIVGFAMPPETYMNPPSYGWESTADLISWVVSFVLIDGKMRGLFSFLFGASMLLVIQRAEAAGEPAERIHFLRMAWLLLFGLIHFYLIWWGDILSHYALVGMAAWFFHDRSTAALVRLGFLFVLIQLLLTSAIAADVYQAAAAASAPGASDGALSAWNARSADYVIAGPDELAATLTLYRGGLGGIVAHQFIESLADPYFYLLFGGWETLGYMLFGMAMLKSGFLTASWALKSYVRCAAIGFGISVPLYAWFALALLRADFSVPAIFLFEMTATTLVRPVMVVAMAAMVIIVTRSGGGWVDRISAAGRAAFSNYLGTSLLMTGLFYGWGLGLFGMLSRAQLWLVVIPMWGLMLLWSKPWLDRYRYGPLEWLWRSLARGGMQPMRR